MKKIFAMGLIAILYLTPLCVFAQKRTLPKREAKAGHLAVNVAYESLETVTFFGASETPSLKSQDGEMITKFTAKFQATENSTVLRHDGTISDIEPMGATATGKLTYEHSGTHHWVSTNDESTTVTEKAFYSGTVSVGQPAIDFGEQGEDLRLASASTSADMEGSSLQETKDKNGTHTDSGCMTGAMSRTMGISDIGIDDPRPNKDKPPEKACTAHANVSYSAVVNAVSDIETPLYLMMPLKKGYTAVSSGGFNQNRWTLTYTGNLFPSGMQIDNPNEKHRFKETLVIEAQLSLAPMKAPKAQFKPTTEDFLALGLRPQYIDIERIFAK